MKYMVYSGEKNVSKVSNEIVDKKLCLIYRECFSGKPYYEFFDDFEIVEMMKSYIRDGILVLCYDEEEIVGFIAAVPLVKEKEIYQMAKEYNIDVENTWYYADIGVAKKNRGNGIAKEMFKVMKNGIVEKKYLLMRTQVGNEISKKMHMSLGFKIIDGMKQVFQRQIKDGEVYIDERIFLIYSN